MIIAISSIDKSCSLKLLLNLTIGETCMLAANFILFSASQCSRKNCNQYEIECQWNPMLIWEYSQPQYKGRVGLNDNFCTFEKMICYLMVVDWFALTVHHGETYRYLVQLHQKGVWLDCWDGCCMKAPYPVAKNLDSNACKHRFLRHLAGKYNCWSKLFSLVTPPPPILLLMSHRQHYLNAIWS